MAGISPGCSNSLVCRRLDFGSLQRPNGATTDNEEDGWLSGDSVETPAPIKSRFFASDGSESDEECATPPRFSSPKKTPEKAGSQQTTPLKLQPGSKWLATADPTVSLNAKERRTLTTLKQALQGLSPNKQEIQKARFANKLLGRLSPSLALPQSALSYKAQQLAAEALKEADDWAAELAGACGKALIIDISHIDQPQATGGWHFSLNPDKEAMFKKRLISTQKNGVYCAKFDLPGKAKEKFSTFFPVMSGDDLVKTIMGAKEIAVQENRSLRLTDRGFYIELYIKGAMITSTFPIFFFADYEKGAQYEILSQKMIAADIVLAVAQDLYNKDRDKAVRFKMGDKIIIDIAPGLKGFDVDHGIYISFPKELFGESKDEGKKKE